MSDTAVVAARLQEIRRIIARHKRWDLLFALLGLCALMLGVLTFVSLFAQMVVEGGPRLSVDFFTNFPPVVRSRRASSPPGWAPPW